jgi:hypothetical protein
MMPRVQHIEAVFLKVMSSKSTVVREWCKSMGMGLRLLHGTVFCRSRWPSSIFCHISISGQDCPINRRVLKKIDEAKQAA